MHEAPLPGLRPVTSAMPHFERTHYTELAAILEDRSKTDVAIRDSSWHPDGSVADAPYTLESCLCVVEASLKLNPMRHTDGRKLILSNAGPNERRSRPVKMLSASLARRGQDLRQDSSRRNTSVTSADEA